MSHADIEEKVALKVIIAGGRDYELTDSDLSRLDELSVKEVVSGGGKGS